MKSNVEKKIASIILSKVLIKYSEPSRLTPAFKKLMGDYSRLVNQGYTEIEAALLSEVLVKYSCRDHEEIYNRLATSYKALNKYLEKGKLGDLESALSELNKDLKDDELLPSFAETLKFTF